MQYVYSGLLFCVLFFPVVDDAVKTENDSPGEITIKAESDSDPCKMDGICPEVIKVYIFKADPGEDDLGKGVIFLERKIKVLILGLARGSPWANYSSLWSPTCYLSLPAEPVGKMV